MMPSESVDALGAPSVASVAELALTRGDLKMLSGYLNARGGEIRFMDLDQIYVRFPALDPTRARFYASLSNGKDIFINRKKHVSVSSMAWDVCHLLGHMVQWNLRTPSGQALGLSYYDGAAREMAVTDFRGGSFDELREVITYEVEANRIAYSILGICLGGPRQRQLRKDFSEYVQHDLTFLLSYYWHDWRNSYESSKLPFEVSLALRSTVPSVIKPLQLPSAEDCPFQVFDILSVPVLHLEHAV